MYILSERQQTIVKQPAYKKAVKTLLGYKPELVKEIYVLKKFVMNMWWDIIDEIAVEEEGYQKFFFLNLYDAWKKDGCEYKYKTFERICNLKYNGK